MNKEEQKILDDFRKLTPENKAIAQSNIYVALAAQENTRKAMITSKSDKKAKRIA